jgi:hypothetical protein
VICLSCALTWGPLPGQACPNCSRPLAPDTPESRDQLVNVLVARRTHALIEGWRSRGLIKQSQAVKLLREVSFEPPPLQVATPASAPPPASEPAVARPIPRQPAAISPPTTQPAEIQQPTSKPAEIRQPTSKPAEIRQPTTQPAEIQQPVSAQLQAERDAYDAALAQAAAGYEPATEGVTAAGDMFLVDGAGAGGQGEAAGALAALVALDTSDEGESYGSLLVENIGWFIGALLVLAGSIYGVREAWVSLSSVPRHLVVSGALLAYHAGFVGVAAAMAQRSVVSGKVLGGIAVLLLPIVFVSLSALVATAPAAGVVAAIGALAVSSWTLRSVAKRFDLPAGMLLRATLPGLVTALPLSALEAGSWARTLLPIVALVGVWPLVGAGAPVGLLGPAMYAALTAELLALVGAGGTDGLAPLGFALWASTLALVLGERTARPPQPRPVLGLLSLGIGAASAIAAGQVLLSSAGGAAASGLQTSAPIAAVSAGLVTLLYLRSLAAFPRAVHLAAPAAALTATLVMSAALPRLPALWPLGGSAVAAALLLGSRQVHGFAIWGLVLGALGALGAQGLATSRDPALLPLLSLLPVVLSGHAAARRDRRWLHLCTGLLALGGVSFCVVTGLDSSLLGPGLIALALAYGLAAPLVDGPAAADGSRPRFDPLDDLSLLALGGAALWYLPRAPSGPGPAVALASVGRLVGALQAGWPLFLVGALLVARARRDHSRIVPLSGFGLILLGLVWSIGPTTLGEHLRLMAELALAFSLLAAGAQALPSSESTRPRALLGLVDLRWASGSHRIADALGATSLIAVGFGMLEGVIWMSSIVEAQRPDALFGALVLLATAASWFLLPSLGDGVRGSRLALWGAVAVGVEAALVNRLGRPLSPPQIGLRFTVMIALLYVVERVLRRSGRKLGSWLGNDDGHLDYPQAPRLGVLALGTLLLLDAALVASKQSGNSLVVAGMLLAVPPTMLLGAALACVLHARPEHEPRWWHDAALGLLLAAGALAGAQHGLAGPAYEQVGATWQLAPPPGSGMMILLDPVTPIRALAAGNGGLIGLLGVAAALAALGLLVSRTPLRAPLSWLFVGDTSEPARDHAAGRLEDWAGAGVLIALVASLWQTSLPGAGLACLTGALVMAAGSVSLGAGYAGLGLAMGAQALAARGPVVQPWIGPLTALLGLGALAAGHRRKEPLFAIQHLIGWGVVGVGLAQGVSAGAAVDLSGGVLPLLISTLGRISNATMATWSTAAGLLAVAAGGAVVFRQSEQRSYGDYSKIGATVASLATAAAACSGWLAWRWAGRASEISLGAEAPAIGLLLAATAIGTHAAGRKFASAAGISGLRGSRDVLLVGTFAASSWAVTQAMSPGAMGLRAGSLAAGVASLLAVGALSLHAAWREGTARHAYFVQLAVVGLYGLLRSSVAPFLPPEADAIFALALGFVLVGVTVLARRAGVPPVANATRLFAALLPIGVALLLRGQAGYTTAMGATGAAMLYGALALVERNRLLGAFGAVAANLALLLAALATGLDGVEIYLAPLGLLLLCLGHLFSGAMKNERAALRLVGTLLLYVPAGWSITFQLGLAPDGRYPLVFGAMCLVGVAVGLLLHIRAYLVLGAFFIALDVVANLVHAGMRDHRVGFVVLSLSGLLILAMMVATTLRREAFRALVARWRRRLSTWE